MVCELCLNKDDILKLLWMLCLGKVQSPSRQTYLSSLTLWVAVEERLEGHKKC